MDALKDSIKEWLKEIGQNRSWLAEQCGVSKRTVDDWLSTSRRIPSKAVLAIQELMGKQFSPSKKSFLTKEEQKSIFSHVISKSLVNLLLKTEAELFHNFSERQLENARKRAKKHGITPKEYYILSYVHHIAKTLEDAETVGIVDYIEGMYDSEEDNFIIPNYQLPQFGDIIDYSSDDADE